MRWLGNRVNCAKSSFRESPLHYKKIHQNYSQTSLKVSSFNLKILMNPPVVQGIHMRVLKLSKADRKEGK